MALDSRRFALFVAVVLAVLTYAQVPLGACTCAPVRSSPCVAASNASHVFAGEVLEVTSAAPGSGIEPFAGRGAASFVRVRFKLLEKFRGDFPAETVDVFTPADGPMCGYPFSRSVGKYLVYAFGATDNGVLTTGVCTRTQPLSAAGEDLRYLRGGPDSRVTSSRLQGDAIRHNPKGGLRSRTPFADARVRLVLNEDPARFYETRTRADGSYSINVPPGKYTVTLETSGELTPAPASAVVFLFTARGCSDINFTVFDKPRSP